MFDFLKGGKATLSLQLDRIGEPYWEGETIHVTVNVKGEKDLKIQKGRIALVYHEKYQYREESRDSDGDSSVTSYWTTEEKQVWGEQFYPETTVKSGTNDSFKYDIPLPPNSPSTGKGQIIQVSWHVKAILERKMASDVQAETEIGFLHAPPGQMNTAGEFGHSDSPADADMALALRGKEFVMGETIAGQLLVRPIKEFDVSEIRVELAQVENVPRGEGNNKVASQKVKLAGGTKLISGQPLTLPFQFTIPSTGAGTAQTLHGTIKWFLTGILSRRMHSDTKVEEELFVYSGRQGESR